MSRAASPWPHLVRWAVTLTVAASSAVVVAGTLVWRLERGADGANLRHWQDGVWWAAVTLATVGYGEHYPVTAGGRLVAVVLMMLGIAVVGAVAALVALALGHRFAANLEATMLQVERQTERIGTQRPTGPIGPQAGADVSAAGLREVQVALPDERSAASLTWLLARLGWHPAADDAGLTWSSAGVALRLAVRPAHAPAPGHLALDAGDADRMHRIAREAGRHGFAAAPAGSAADRPSDPAERVRLRTETGLHVTLLGTRPPADD